MSLKRFLFLFAIAALIAWLLRSCFFEGIYVATASMEPTLPVGTHVFLDKFSYRFRGPERGEIVVLRAPVPPHEEMVKRVIAVGGDRIELREKRVYIDGKPLEEPYVQYTRKEERLRGDDLGPWTVPDGHVFVLGDNRDESNDSTVWMDEEGERVSFLPVSDIRGRIRGVY